MDKNTDSTFAERRAPAESSSSAAKRITRNSFYLILRTVLIMCVSLYTSRISLQLLGETDYGIYSLVAGFVLFFGFLNISMERATSRFLMYERSAGTQASMTEMFNVAIYAHASIAAVVVLLGETVGLWYLNYHLNIPADRMVATNWIYQLALLTLVFNVMKVPYNACIVAYEKMSFYAFLAMGEVVLRLAAIMSLFLIKSDLLVLYALQWLLVTVVVFTCYKVFCRKHFPICRFRWQWNGRIYLRLLSFSGWSTLGSGSGIFALQGVAVLVNKFIGVVANAAFGLAVQIYQAMFGILNSFQTAFSPRLVGLYAQRKMDELREFIYNLGRYSYYVGALISFPVCINMSLLLHTWLGDDVPEYTVQFGILVILANFFDCISAPGLVCNQATGRVRNFNIVWSLLLLSNLLFSWIALRVMNCPAPSVFVVRLIVSGVIYLFITITMRIQVGLSAWRYIFSSLLKPGLLCLPALALSLWIAFGVKGWGGLLLNSIAFIAVYALTIYLLGLTPNEKRTVQEFIRCKMQRN